MSNNETALARLLDEAAIRDATARFAAAAIRADYDRLRTVWADDVEWTIGKPPKVHAAGVDAIVSMLRQLRAEREFFVQFAVQGPIEIDGDAATTHRTCHEAARGPGETTTGTTLSPLTGCGARGTAGSSSAGPSSTSGWTPRRSPVTRSSFDRARSTSSPRTGWICKREPAPSHGRVAPFNRRSIYVLCSRSNRACGRSRRPSVD